MEMHFRFYDKEGSICCLCGEKITRSKNSRHHVIPRMIKPKNNIIIPLHSKCHQHLNIMYVLNKGKVKKYLESKSK